MAVKVEHWLYGTAEFNVGVEEESRCCDCAHKLVCRQDLPEFCENYNFGTSSETRCYSCLHHYTRFDTKQPIKCFACKHEITVGGPKSSFFK